MTPFLIACALLALRLAAGRHWPWHRSARERAERLLERKREQQEKRYA